MSKKKTIQDYTRKQDLKRIHNLAKDYGVPKEDLEKEFLQVCLMNEIDVASNIQEALQIKKAFTKATCVLILEGGHSFVTMKGEIEL